MVLLAEAHAAYVAHVRPRAFVHRERMLLQVEFARESRLAHRAMKRLGVLHSHMQLPLRPEREPGRAVRARVRHSVDLRVENAIRAVLRRLAPRAGSVRAGGRLVLGARQQRVRQQAVGHSAAPLGGRRLRGRRAQRREIGRRAICGGRPLRDGRLRDFGRRARQGGLVRRAG